MGKNGVLGPGRPKTGFWAPGRPPFTSTSRGGPPVTPRRGNRGFGVLAPWARKVAPGPRGVLRSSPGPLRDRRNRGAPARGVDVKPPSRGPPGSAGSRDPGFRASPGVPSWDGDPSGSRRSRGPGPGPGQLPRSRDPGSPDGVRDPVSGSPAPGGGPQRGCFTSTPRGGAPRYWGPGPGDPGRRVFPPLDPQGVGHGPMAPRNEEVKALDV